MLVFVLCLYFRPYLYCMQCFVQAQQGSGVITSRARMLHNHYYCLHHSQYHRQHLASSASSTSSSFLCLSLSTSLYSFSLSSYQCHNFYHIMDIITIKNNLLKHPDHHWWFIIVTYYNFINYMYHHHHWSLMLSLLDRLWMAASELDSRRKILLRGSWRCWEGNKISCNSTDS